MSSPTERFGAWALRTRWLVRTPIWLYRTHLGFLFGHRLLMLEHIGRKSGRPRYVVLEVADRTDRSYTVTAGFGEQAQWLRNLEANPNARLWISRQVGVPVTARRLSPTEAAEALRNYAARHPRAWSKLRPVLEQTLGEPINESGTTLPMIRLTMSHVPSRADRSD